MAYRVPSRLLKTFSMLTFSILHNDSVHLALFYGMLFLPKQITVVECLIVLATTPKCFSTHEAIEVFSKVLWSKHYCNTILFTLNHWVSEALWSKYYGNTRRALKSVLLHHHSLIMKCKWKKLRDLITCLWPHNQQMANRGLESDSSALEVISHY